ncbi:hypothetical protein UT4_04560 [Ferrigenium sp. UT4]
MKFSKSAVALFVLGALATQYAQATNGYFAHGYGIKSKGMAGVGYALPQDSIAAAINPAGMALLGDRMDVGLDLFRPQRQSSVAGNGAGLDGTYKGNDTSVFPIPEFGYNKMIRPDMSLGVSVYGNGGMNTDYKNSPFTAFGGSSPAGVNLAQLFVAPTVAFKLGEHNAVGVSLNLAYQIFEAKGLQPFQAPGFSSDPNHVTNNGVDGSAGYGVHIGWTGQVTDMISLGATYQSKTNMQKFKKYAGLFAQGGGFDIPATYGAGIAVRPLPQTVIGFDVQQIQYGDVKSIANTNAQGGPLGAANGAGFGWQNMTAYKFGISHEYDKQLTLRAGFSTNNQQIPSSQTFFNILAPGVVKQHLTLGGTWTLENKSELTVGYLHAFSKTIRGSGSIAPSFGGGEANIKMYQDSIGVAYGWQL